MQANALSCVLRQTAVEQSRGQQAPSDRFDATDTRADCCSRAAWPTGAHARSNPRYLSLCVRRPCRATTASLLARPDSSRAACQRAVSGADRGRTMPYPTMGHGISLALGSCATSGNQRHTANHSSDGSTGILRCRRATFPKTNSLRNPIPKDIFSELGSMGLFQKIWLSH